MTLKSRAPIPIYYESLYGICTLNPFRVHFVLKEWACGSLMKVLESWPSLESSGCIWCQSVGLASPVGP